MYLICLRILVMHLLIVLSNFLTKNTQNLNIFKQHLIWINKYVLLRAKKVGHQISVSFEKFDVVQALLSFFLTLFQPRFQLTV
jgi:hypothetical protein